MIPCPGNGSLSWWQRGVGGMVHHRTRRAYDRKTTTCAPQQRTGKASAVHHDMCNQAAVVHASMGTAVHEVLGWGAWRPVCVRAEIAHPHNSATCMPMVAAELSCAEPYPAPCKCNISSTLTPQPVVHPMSARCTGDVGGSSAMCYHTHAVREMYLHPFH
jgi:hypothetical protein